MQLEARVRQKGEPLTVAELALSAFDAVALPLDSKHES